MRLPARLDLYAWQNAGFETILGIFENGVPYDLTGLTGTDMLFQVRAQPGQTGTALISNDLTSGLALDVPAQGTFRVNALKATLAAIAIPDKFQALQLYWDVVVTPASGLPFVAIEGFFFLKPGVARA